MQTTEEETLGKTVTDLGREKQILKERGWLEQS